jgi:hypothetical protein
LALSVDARDSALTIGVAVYEPIAVGVGPIRVGAKGHLDEVAKAVGVGVDDRRIGTGGELLRARESITIEIAGAYFERGGAGIGVAGLALTLLPRRDAVLVAILLVADADARFSFSFTFFFALTR